MFTPTAPSQVSPRGSFYWQIFPSRVCVQITAGTTQRIKKYILHITGKEDNLPALTGRSDPASPEHVAYVPAEWSQGS